MGKPISVGDLVMVVRGKICGCKSRSDGCIFIVNNIYRGNGLYDCLHSAYDDIGAKDITGKHFVDLQRLKRIDPPATGDSLPTRKERKEIA